MILYTEKQLIEAYSAFVARLMIAKKDNNLVEIPSLEDFRKIYEAEWELYYNDQELH
tara:strand:+ start:8652 stop:8822 length:171 start_codon:yes stop_codon:yes gene_type:complete